MNNGVISNGKKSMKCCECSPDPNITEARHGGIGNRIDPAG
jgi:hypothetical protein